MAAQYGYYIDGKKVAILKKYVTSLGQNGTYIESDYWGTPDTADTDAIMFQYQPKISAPTDETTDINVNDVLALAIVEYVKYRLAEDDDQYNKAKHHYRQFKIKVNEAEDNDRGTPVVMVPSSVSSLR